MELGGPGATHARHGVLDGAAAGGGRGRDQCSGSGLGPLESEGSRHARRREQHGRRTERARPGRRAERHEAHRQSPLARVSVGQRQAPRPRRPLARPRRRPSQPQHVGRDQRRRPDPRQRLRQPERSRLERVRVEERQADSPHGAGGQQRRLGDRSAGPGGRLERGRGGLPHGHSLPLGEGQAERPRCARWPTIQLAQRRERGRAGGGGELRAEHVDGWRAGQDACVPVAEREDDRPRPVARHEPVLGRRRQCPGSDHRDVLGGFPRAHGLHLGRPTR